MEAIVKVKLSDVRAEVNRLNSVGKKEEAATLWYQGVCEMYAGRIIDDEKQ